MIQVWFAYMLPEMFFETMENTFCLLLFEGYTVKKDTALIFHTKGDGCISKWKGCMHRVVLLDSTNHKINLSWL